MDLIFLFPASLLVLFAHEGHAATSQIKCYHCSSNESYADCEIKQEKQCDINVPGYDWTCGKFKNAVHMHNMTTIYYSRDCILANKCKDDAYCKAKRMSFEAAVGVNATDLLAEFTCTMHCCKEDLCNAAPTVVRARGFAISVFTAFALLFLYFFH